MGEWKKMHQDDISRRVFDALKGNVDFRKEEAIGVPASHLDSNVFYVDAPFLKDAPYISSMVANPNHIGCHTLGDSEEFFAGTQQIERDVIRICAEDILKGEENNFDGYVTAGGTEANIEAYWIYRNYFLKEYDADVSQIGLLSSEDSHYSINKGANLLNLKLYSIPVDHDSRMMQTEVLSDVIQQAQNEGVQYFIVQLNMATTMFGSVDDINMMVNALLDSGVEFKIHVDGAYGGFIYPFTTSVNKLNFKNPYISSFSLDAHKMLQAPYGTGIFLSRKNLMKFVYTEEAQYVNGMDITLSGSRSGANAIAVWMILMTYGPFGWQEKIFSLIQRTDWLCKQLDLLGMKYFRYDTMNIVTIDSQYLSEDIAKKYGLVPKTHTAENQWWKIVIMDHVSLDVLSQFVEEIKSEREVLNA